MNRNRPSHKLGIVCSTLALAALAVTGLSAPSAVAAEKVTYLFPAPPILPAFGPIQLAKGKKYFEAEGLEVEFQTAKGGVDVAKQLGAGNAPLGGILADGPIIVRGNDVPIKTVAVFGGQGFMQLVVREDSGITEPKQLKGKAIGVMSYQDTTFYALQGVLASAGLKVSDVNAQSVGPVNVWKMVATGDFVGCACVPDWIPPIEAQGVKVRILPSDQYFPAMAQAIGASDETIKKNPEMIQKFVRAALKGMKDMMDNPEQAAADFVSYVPQWKGKEKEIATIFKYYVKLVYPGQEKLGEVNVERLTKLQDFYLKEGIIQKAVPVADLYTNQFIK